jgi:ADP-ribosylglycohydrolase
VSRNPLPADYLERVYAGALGKVIGVYLGRPFEGWSHDRIMRELGQIDYYVHDKLDVPLLVTDDDITGTFTFLRALPDYGNDADITPAQIGQTWLNYIIEGRTILWWGGLGNSTEHTAFLRLKHGIEAPRSGSIELNGQVVAEQIGAQIFIDGWALVSPGRPDLAAELARRAGTVSHDGEAVHAARALAAMEAQAFVESDLDTLLDTGLSFIPADSVVARMVRDIRDWHRTEPDWRRARDLLDESYGYDSYGGNCHVIPNHGLIVLALLYGGGEWDRSMMIVNTCGWDTDCNSGNLGCLLGIRNGLDGFGTAHDWRGPVADRIYLSTADGGRAITDVAAEAVRIANIGRALAGQESVDPKDGSRFHFELSGSLQGFQLTGGSGDVANVEGALAVRWADSSGATATTPTFIPPEATTMPGYSLMASPTLYPGQRLQATVSADAGNGDPVDCRLVVTHYAGDDGLVTVAGSETTLRAGEVAALTWTVPDTGGQPIASVGITVTPGADAPGTVRLDRLTWDGVPDVLFGRPADGGSMWHRAWVDGLDDFGARWPETYRLIQNDGRGLLMQGTREWADYQVSATVTPHMAEAAGIAARVQGLRRYYAVLIGNDGRARLVKSLDGERVLAETALAWELGRVYHLSLTVTGNRIQAAVDGAALFDIEDAERPLDGGGIALVIQNGRAGCEEVRVRPAG